jgi:type II secretory pathway component PulC
MQENMPEEKLLKLIRGKKGIKENPQGKPLVKAKERKAFETRYFFIFLNGLLIAAAIALVGFLTYRVFFSVKENKSLLLEPAPSVIVENETKGVIPEKPPFQYYKNQFSKRDLFERPLDQVAANASVDLTKRYKLVGIVLGVVPEAIIEDLSTKKTVFIHEGEFLDAVKVQKIEEGRVVFLQEGLEIELKQ